MCSIMEGNDTPSVLTDWLRLQCVVIGVKRLKVLTTCREFWVSGKPSNQSARGVDIPPTTRICFFWLLDSTCSDHTTGVHPALWKCVWSCSCLWWTCPRVGMKGKRLLQNEPLVFQACELGLSLQGWKFDSESSVSRGD
jgi:hypothetical protein